MTRRGRKASWRGPSASSEKLRRLLLGDSPMARAIRQQFERSMLWRFRTGRRTPGLETALDLATITRGRLSLEGWLRRP